MKDLEQMTDDELDAAIIQQASGQVQEIDYSTMSDDELDELLIQKTISETPQDRPGEAFVQNFGNAASFGYLPQIQAAAEPLIQGVADYFSGDETDAGLAAQGFNVQEAPKESYVQRRDRSINELDQISRENPKSAMAGQITGAVVGGIATAGGVGRVIGGVGKAATVGQRFAQAAKTGGVIGAIRNPGDTEGEVNALQLGNRAENAVKDAATGLVVQGGLEGVKAGATVVKNAGKNLKTWSQNKALKSAGYAKKDFERAFGKKKTAELGQAIIDGRLAGIGDDITDISKNADKALKKAGEKIGAVYDKADEITSLSQGDLRGLNNEFIEESSKRLEGTIRGEDVAKKIDDVMGIVNGQKNPTFGQLRKLRSSIDDEINFSKQSNELPLYQEELLHLRNKVNDLVKKKIGDVSPSLRNELIKENKKFSQLSDISKISRKKMAGEESNAAFGLRERISGGVGATVGAAIGGLPGAIIGGGVGAISTKVARQYGTPFIAMTANKVAKALERNQEALGKFSKPLIEAASNPEKYVASINLLMKDPEFKKSVQEMNGGAYRGPAKGKAK